MNPGEIRIPKTQLGKNIDRTVTNKRDAQHLLLRIETSYVEHRPSTSWRHDPSSWNKAKRG